MEEVVTQEGGSTILGRGQKRRGGSPGGGGVWGNRRVKRGKGGGKRRDVSGQGREGRKTNEKLGG